MSKAPKDKVPENLFSGAPTTKAAALPTRPWRTNQRNIVLQASQDTVPENLFSGATTKKGDDLPTAPWRKKQKNIELKGKRSGSCASR